jgi:hypothetical protein
MKSILLVVTSLIWSISYGQIKIIGRVLDSDTNKPIRDVNIIILGTSGGTSTNIAGFFELELSKTQSLLIASHVTYGTYEISVPAQDKFTFYMTRSRIELPDLDTRLSIEESSNTESEEEYIVLNGDTLNIVESNAQFRGGIKSLFTYLNENIELSDEMKESGFVGNLLAYFTINESGKAVNIKVNGNSIFDMENHITSAISNMPDWIPAKQRHNSVEQDFSIKIIYGNLVYLIADNPAVFPGGIEALHKYIIKNVNIPKEAKRKGVKGRVYVQFIVNDIGDVVENSVQAIRGLGYGIDEEVIRVVKTSPKWSPATLNDKAVYSRMVLPITFN